MRNRATGVWLNGERFDVVYFLDLEADRIQRFVMKGPPIGRTGGVCRRIRGGYLAWFVSPVDRTLTLWMNGTTYSLEGSLLVSHRVRWKGIGSTLVIKTAGGVEARFDALTPARAILHRLDPAYDALDESTDDLLADVADIASSQERRDWIIEVKDPTEGPWYLLEGGD